MKAIVYSDYGSPGVLKCEEVEKPATGVNEVLIKVRAASLNPLDWHFMRGTPYVARIGAGMRKPKRGRLGVDVAGEVEAVGGNVTQFRPGDAVFGTCRGALAEFACAPESALAAKPENVTFEQAASVPVAAFTALQGLRDAGRLQPGQTVLINGAAGGVGTFAVQIAQWLGALVTGVCSTRNVEMVRSIGAGRVIDYAQEDFTQGAQRYDLILDCIGNHPVSACRRVLNPKGSYIIVGGPSANPWLDPFPRVIKALSLSMFVSQRLLMMLTKANPKDLATLSELMQSGKIAPVIDRRYSLIEAPEAMRYLETGHARGKVVVNLA